MKHFRMKLGAAALIATATMAACGGRETGGGGTNNDDAGCTGACSTDAGNTGTDGGGNTGTDGGGNTGTDGGGNTGTDAGGDGGTQPSQCPAPVDGKGPIGLLRANGGYGQLVMLDGLVIVSVDYLSKPGSKGDYVSEFWVVNPCFPSEGIYVEKYYTDPTTNYAPAVGDVVTIEGYFRNYNQIASDAPDDRDAYRLVLKSTNKLTGSTTTLPIKITKTGTVAPPPDNTVPADGGFGNADGGAVMASPEYAGSRVYIPGPLTLTNPNPEAFTSRPGDPNARTFYGFEVSGGILVNNYKTFGETRDGGSTRCDWRVIANDGGVVTFPNGIRGVWDTYSYVPCGDGGYTLPDGGAASSCSYAKRDAGYVPGTDQQYTYVLYPQDCENDLPGVVGVPTDDAGTPPVDDAGTPPVDDAGTPVDDGGVTIVDAG